MLTILGCGNLNRGDDGVGVVVVQRLIERFRRHPVPGVRAFDVGTGGMEVLFSARGSEALLVLDACRTGAEPGAIFDVPGDELARDREPSYSLHDFRWDNALAAGKKIYKDAFPAEVRVFLVEGSSFGLGLELSAPVAAAGETLFQRALAHAAEYAARRHARTAAVEVVVKRGAIQLPRAVYDAYFDGRDGALLVEHEGALCLLPVEQVSGGALVKQRNLEGDRVVVATEFLRAHKWDDGGEYRCRARWDAALGGLAVEMPARTTS